MLRRSLAPRAMLIEALEDRRLLAFNPTATEQELLQLVNRFRTDPKGEFARLISTTSPLRARDPILQNDLDFAKVNGSVLKTQMESLAAVPPLAWNEAVSSFTASHNAKMIASNPPQQFHSDSLVRRQALLDAGVKLRFQSGEKISSENVYGFGKSALHTFAAFAIDWDQGGPNGMRADLGHRLALLSPEFEQIGMTVTPYTGDNFGPQVTTQVLVNIEAPPIMVVGAVFEDRNASTWYEAGEGIGSVQIVFSGVSGTFTTTSLGAGGYQLALPAGTYRATATGGGMKHAVVVENITVGTSNVWKNLVYDPTAIPPDAREPNNALTNATLLSGANQTLTGLSIHSASDIDLFRLNSLGTGTATFTIQFSNAAGNLDLRLLNSSGGEIAKSAGTGNTEVVTANVTRGSTLYVEVRGSAGAQNGAYTLIAAPPAPAPPIAEIDQASVSSVAPRTTLNLIANDRDPDGPVSKLVPKLATGTSSAFALAGTTLTYTAPAGFKGVHRATYTVTDDQGLVSAPGKIEIFVVNFAAEKPWQNIKQPSDINDDGSTTPLDALLIVNEINSLGARSLPTSVTSRNELFGFVDSTGEGFLSALDVLLVVNRLNGATGEGELAPTALRPSAPEAVNELAANAPAAKEPVGHDLAVAEMFGGLPLLETELAAWRKRKVGNDTTEIAGDAASSPPTPRARPIWYRPFQLQRRDV